MGEAPPLSVDQLEEEVMFSEWRELRSCSSRSLERTRALMRALGYSPSRQAHATLGVVGSKGKGTAAAYASATLAGAGWRVCTIMSPGVLSNADRIRLQGTVLEESTRRRLLNRLATAQQSLPAATAQSGYLAPTGLFLLMGFLAAEEAGVDVVVAEAGIGGASDDLSQWPLDAVILTEIFGEHLDILGPTVADVAQDKAAVITPDTRFAVSLPQYGPVADIIRSRCAHLQVPLHQVGSESQGQKPGHSQQHDVVLEGFMTTLPPGFQRTNAMAGVRAGLLLGELDRGTAQVSEISQAVGAAVASVHYPGRLSVHRSLGLKPGGPGVVVDSAVSAAGLGAALEFSETALEDVEQVLVCIPPSKNLASFIQPLVQFAGRKVFVHLPGAYTGMPTRDQWPSAPGWEWLELNDLTAGGQQPVSIREATWSGSLHQALVQGNTLAVGTVLFTALVLRSLGAETRQLFEVPARVNPAG